MYSSDNHTRQSNPEQLLSYKKIKPGKITGEIFAPPSKSISHRLLILGALSKHACEISNILLSEDILITIEALLQMGFRLDLQGNTVIFSGERRLTTDTVSIDLGNSGTSARFISALAAVTPGHFLLTGSERMMQRPMEPLFRALTDLGANIQHSDGFLPANIFGSKSFTQSNVTVDATKSSQFISALILIAPYTEQGLNILIKGSIASEAYVTLTWSTLEMVGLRVQNIPGGFRVPGQQSDQFDKIQVEGDYSSISYFAVGAAITGGNISLQNLSRESAQGDKKILDILKTAGARVSRYKHGYSIKSEVLNGFEADMLNYPDLVPAVSILALFCKGMTRLSNIEHLQYKESNRIQAIISNISNLGGSCKLDGQDLVIDPQPLRGGLIRTFNDHRIAMSFSILGLRIPGIKIENPDCVRKSYPDFWDDLSRIYQGSQGEKNQTL